MKVKLSKSAKKDIKKLDKNIRKKVYKEIELLRQGKTRIVKLKGYADTGRVRVDDYRILFRLDKDVLILIAVLKRKDAYRHF